MTRPEWLELARSMRSNLAEVPGLRLLDGSDSRETTPDVEEFERIQIQPIDGVCSCGRLLEVGDAILCAECAELGGLE